MRVIGGQAKGHRLRVPSLAGLRPTSDRVREAVFDVLESRGLVEGAAVLDLFAGSGALGIEALSRGAASAVFVESDRRAARAIEENLTVLGPIGGRGRVVRAQVVSFLSGGATADVALVDPPYSFGEWAVLLELLAGTVEIAVLEHTGALELAPHFETLRAYRHGGTLLTLARAASPPGVA
ncbi:MAG: 16S rRNA (guanine(966)-N(2))-methyltransferase RsmD [Actinomycetota bacterium]|nr:16S rRNA (guanine(966)-N(2))-methyltransferase RsmD [Actinomycetota bacterium]